VFTEAGFGFDLGAEKFLDIKCRTGGLWPHAVVLVCSLSALRYHGGLSAEACKRPDRAALQRGMANLDKHLESIRGFGIDPVVAVNGFEGDPADETALLLAALAERGVPAGVVDVYRRGGEGATEVAGKVLERVRAANPTPRFTYELADHPYEKVKKIARAIYGARDVDFTSQARGDIERAVQNGFGELPVCMAKTHLSLSDDPKKVGRPTDFVMTVREVRVSAGAGFLVPLTGEILTMPGLPRKPHAAGIDLLPDGTIVGAV
jgi:formate--tetrahydrofolate ligase